MKCRDKKGVIQRKYKSVRENRLVKMFAVVGYHTVVCKAFILCMVLRICFYLFCYLTSFFCTFLSQNALLHVHNKPVTIVLHSV